MSADHAAALKAMAICRALSDAELGAVAAIAAMQEIAAGQDLFREGEPGEGLYLVISGEIDVIKRGPRGERTLARLGPGGVLGEMSLITSDTRSATGRAATASRVLRLPADRFRALLADGSSAALKIVAQLAAVMAQRLALMNTKVLELADKVEAGGGAVTSLKDKELAELHRTMQVWSF